MASDDTVVVLVGGEPVDIQDVLDQFLGLHYDFGPDYRTAGWFADAARAVNEGQTWWDKPDSTELDQIKYSLPAGARLVAHTLRACGCLESYEYERADGGRAAFGTMPCKHA